jgi:HSP20 family molecular chaperone IbpA
MNQNISQAMQPTRQADAAMFSLAESDSHYLVAVDIPTIPTTGAEILTSRGQLTVEGQSEDSHERQTIFRMFPQGKGIKTVYLSGVLYLLLPKIKMEIPA